MNPLPPLLPFFGLGATNNAAKPDCVLPIGDDGSSNGRAMEQHDEEGACCFQMNKNYYWKVGKRGLL
jgi:hypothetical protein